MSTSPIEDQILARQLEKAREDNEAGKQARAVLDRPDVQHAFEELKSDAPEGQGPFLRNVDHLKADPMEGAGAPESERSEERVADHPTANPVGLGKQPKVMVVPRVSPDAHVTGPDMRKRKQLGLLDAIEPSGRTVGGQTLKLGAAQEIEDATSAKPTGAVVVRETRRFWLWAAVVVTLLGVLVWIVLRIAAPGETPTADASSRAGAANDTRAATAPTSALPGGTRSTPLATETALPSPRPEPSVGVSARASSIPAAPSTATSSPEASSAPRPSASTTSTPAIETAKPQPSASGEPWW